MLKVINLYVINKIFDEFAILKLSANEKMLYISCLIYYFTDKKATIENNTGFYIHKSEIKKYEKFEKQFMRLHLAELIVLQDESIYFSSCWDNYVDNSLFEKTGEQKKQHPFGEGAGTIEMFIGELRSNMTLPELLRMKYRLEKEEVKNFIELFYVEQKEFAKSYFSYSDCSKHFTYWVAGQIKNKPPKQEKSVKSNNKILGYE